MTRSKTIIAAAFAILVVAIVVAQLARGPSYRQVRQLPDGALLVLNRVSFSGTNEFTHGIFVEKVLGKLIPSKGVKIFSFQFTRPIVQRFDCPPGKSQLAVEFQLIGTNAANHPLVTSGFYQQFRCVIRGEAGIEYVYNFWPGGYRKYSDGYFGYVIANRYPRDSSVLWLRVEHRPKPDESWKQVAEFEIRHPPQPTMQLWSAEPTNAPKEVGDLEISLGQITVSTQSLSASVTVPFQVRKNGLLLTNWGAAYTRFEDSTGNWDYSFGRLDPRYVWKINADFELESDFPLENLLTLSLSITNSTISTNLMNTPLTISWDGNHLEAHIPTKHSDLALRFVSVTDEQGRKGINSSGSWNQHYFRKGNFMVQTDRGLTTSDFHLATATVAIVPNVHATFYAQPSLIIETNPVRGPNK